MKQDKLLEEIRSRGHWRIEIRSTEYNRTRLPTRLEMHNALNAATVSLRGWPYPYFPPKADEQEYDGKSLTGWVDWDYFKEYWRLYESGQWIQYLGLQGAWINRETLFKGRYPLPPAHSGYVHVRGVLFVLTEILRFAVGLAQQGILNPTVFLSIQLHNTRDYMLWEGPDRFFPLQYVNPLDKPVEQEYAIPSGEISAIADQKALELAVKIFSIFGWIPADAAIRTLVEDQKKLIERRL